MSDSVNTINHSSNEHAVCSGPLVSIIVPCYNMGPYIGEALASVSAQSYGNWELIAVDDCGPPDGTLATIRTFEASHPGHRVKLIVHQHNQGVCAARKSAMRAACGEYFAFLDPDDAFMPQKLEKQVEILQSHPEVVLVHTAVTGLGQAPGHLPPAEQWFSEGAAPGVYSLPQQERYLVWNNICNSTVMCRASAVDLDEFPNAMVFQLEDYFLWCLLSRHGLFYQMPEPLAAYRIHEGSYITNQLARPGKEELSWIEFYLRIFNTLPGSQARMRAAKQLWIKLSRLVPRRPGEQFVSRQLEFSMLLLMCRKILGRFKRT